ncbi:hypothetical protein SEA_SLOOPYJOE_36 [Arthrobacter phage Sloopyjoe]|nr:hypothetical protein PBI_STAYER_36 [Arthrobacter phage Stayer]QFG09745.1 hypothetical protein PBI_SHIBA_36 [Arthrobacter phage Shiba]QFG10180.1 hypothetical protein PBI_EGAD_36 [Arthrobacter phage Egad]QFG11750.1 hypothetical protein PBI_SALK_36 [Arthrobacter phage Salk]QFG12633.1 hypothetical protein PBI_MICHELLE_36 [Arthrobacter phage Michelle]QFG14406.1 hypothetical protein PBI_STARLORD_36 [Arthrobacter phage StarLord]UVT31114.1 hypothetical protein PBI_LINDA_36 [Arthrobacter phage Lind
MFKKHSINIKFVKDAEQTPMEETVKTNPFINEETVAHAKDFVKHAAVATVAVMGAAAAFKTINQISVIAAESAFNKKQN